MSIWGKIIGAAAGLAIGGPLGALAGGAAGHALDVGLSTPAETGDATRSIAFTIAVVALGAKMAKADGFVSDAEIVAFREVFRVPPDELRNVERVFNVAKRDTAGWQSYARQIGDMFPDRPEVLEDLVMCLFHIAKADGGVKEEEREFLRGVAETFGLPRSAFARLCAEAGGGCENDPYGVLGLDLTADDDAVRTAYRALMREHHPDRLIAAGMPQEFIVLANEKAATINTAYEKIRRERGMN
jgi:DnaJ like chaperone protein